MRALKLPKSFPCRGLSSGCSLSSSKTRQNKRHESNNFTWLGADDRCIYLLIPCCLARAHIIAQGRSSMEALSVNQLRAALLALAAQAPKGQQCCINCGMPIQSVLQASQDSKTHATSPQPSHLVRIHCVFISIAHVRGSPIFLCGPYSLWCLRMAFWRFISTKTCFTSFGCPLQTTSCRRGKPIVWTNPWVTFRFNQPRWWCGSKRCFQKPSIQEWSAMLGGIFGTRFRHGNSENIYKKLQDDLRSTGSIR